MRTWRRKHVNVTLTFVMECRVCLSSAAPERLVSLCGVLSHKIMCCTSITIDPDNRLPTHICPSCEERLNASYDFKVLCEHSDYVLRKRIHSTDCIPKLEPSEDALCNRIFETPQLNFRGVPESDSSDTQNIPKYIISSNKQHIKVEEVKSDNSPMIKTRIISDDNVSSEDDLDSVIDTSPCEDQIDCDSEPLTRKTTVKTMKSRNNLENKKVATVRSRSERVAKKVKSKSYQMNSDDADIKTCVYSKEIKSKVIQKKKSNGASREQCSICGKTVSTKFRLKMHLRTHTGEKPFSCRYCEKTFGTAQNLKVHERVHTGEKPLLCGTCGKAFAQSAGLVAHMRLHTGEMPYKCTLCPSSFRTPGHLQYHIKQHTGEKSHECVNCKKAFISRGDLTQHMKIHTGERPYVCSVCGFRMARSGHLHRHMKIHTGEKPHKCHTCDNSFVQKGDLVRHMKKHLKSNACKMEKMPKH